MYWAFFIIKQENCITKKISRYTCTFEHATSL